MRDALFSVVSTSHNVTSAPSTMLRMVPLPRRGRGRLVDDGISASPAGAGEVARDSVTVGAPVTPTILSR